MSALRLGISTCPNDTFIYEALVRGQTCSGRNWDVAFADVETLNEMVLEEKLDVAKVSCGVLPFISDAYRLLPCGGAMGYGCGPLLLASKKSARFNLALETILPGKFTTAALLFRFWFAQNFGDIEPKVSYAFFDEAYENLCQGKAAQSVVIHEKRFTWKNDGLECLADLGAFWESRTQSPIPLGCTVAKKSLGEAEFRSIVEEIRQSLSIAKSRTNPISDFICEKAKIRDDSVILQHIRMFVSDFTWDIGEEGRKALNVLSEHADLKKNLFGKSV